MITVAELIQKLSTMNPNAIVTVSAGDLSFSNAASVSSYGYSACECDSTTLLDWEADEHGNYGCCEHEGTVHCVAISG